MTLIFTEGNEGYEEGQTNAPSDRCPKRKTLSRSVVTGEEVDTTTNGHESSLIFTEAKEPESWRQNHRNLHDAPANEDETSRALSSSELLIMLEMGHEHF